MCPESTNLHWVEAATMVAPLGLVLMATRIWLGFLFKEDMGPDDVGVVVWTLFMSLSTLAWALILVAASRHRHRSRCRRSTSIVLPHHSGHPHRSLVRFATEREATPCPYV